MWSNKGACCLLAWIALHFAVDGWGGGSKGGVLLDGVRGCTLPMMSLRLRGGGGGGSSGGRRSTADSARGGRHPPSDGGGQGGSPVTEQDVIEGEESSLDGNLDGHDDDVSCKRLLGMGESSFDRLEDYYLNSEAGREYQKNGGGLELVEEDSEFDKDYYDTFQRVMDSKTDNPLPRGKRKKAGDDATDDSSVGGQPRNFFEELDYQAEKDLLRGDTDSSAAGFAIPPVDDDIAAERADNQDGSSVMEGLEELGDQQPPEDEGGVHEGMMGRDSSEDVDPDHVQSVWKSVMHEARKHKLQRSMSDPPSLIQTYGEGGNLGRPVKFEDSVDETEDPDAEELDADGEDVFVSEDFADDEDQEMLREVKAMAQRERDSTLRDVCRHIPEHVIYPRDHCKQVSLCIRAGACLKNTTDVYRWTVLHHAAFHGHARVCRHLVRVGCDMEAVNKDGYTPIMCAARYGRREAAQVLVEMGANVKHCSKDGETLLDKARRGGNQKLIVMLDELFEQMEEEEILKGRKPKDDYESLYDIYPDEKTPLRYKDDTGRWQTLNTNTTEVLPQHKDQHIWRPLGWSYKDIDRLNRYEKTLPGWKEAQMAAEDSDQEEIDLTRLL